MLPSRIILLYWVQIPSIVFDQGALAVWGEDRLAAEKYLHIEENFSFLDSFSSKSLQDSNPYDSGLNFISAFHDPLFGVNKHFEMNTPDRTRKCSISDIIDVINEDKSFLQSFNAKDEGYDSGNAECLSSPSKILSDGINSYIDEKEDPLSINVDSKDKNAQFIERTENIAMKDFPFRNNSVNGPCNFSTTSASLQEEDMQITLKSALLKSENDAVIVVINKSKKVQYVSTSREKLENFLKQESPVDNNPLLFQEEDEETDTISTDTLMPNEIPKPIRKRGRKCLYTCSNDEEREYSKRVRNNEACRKFRKGKTNKLNDLYESESKLLQHNLSLKEEIAVLQQQLDYIKKKLEEHKEETQKDE